MTIYINDFTVWENLTPIVLMAGDPEFGIWENLVPLVDIDEGNPNQTTKRRRTTIY